MHFLQQLTDSMGQNVKFRTRKILEGDDLTVAANWHLGHIPILDLLFFSACYLLLPKPKVQIIQGLMNIFVVY